MAFLNDCAGRFKTTLRDEQGKSLCTLLWGDPLERFERKDDLVRVRGRRQVGWLPASQVGDVGLLELYIIDVGQGDAVLMRTPHDDAWHLIDGGAAAAEQMTRKGAANFVRWKFIDELRRPAVQLRHMVMTHPDADHFGGLADVLSGALPDGRRFAVEVENFWHNAMPRFAGSPELGQARRDTSRQAFAAAAATGAVPRAGASFLIDLLDGRESFLQPPRAFADTPRGSFARLAEAVARVPQRVGRLHLGTGWLPGYAPGDGGPTTVRVLGPLLEPLAGGGSGLRSFGAVSETRNGHSVVLRVDHGRARLLLTGDLNADAQRLLMAAVPAAEFEADVAKGCHHGSDDVDLAFVRAMAARATVISSGDSENYAHPRPRILGASGRYGRELVDTAGAVQPPLIYSTELARSVALQFASRARLAARPNEPIPPDDLETGFGSRDTGRYRRLARLPIATDLVYGLVNVRTDGDRILMGYMKEGSHDFDIQVFRAATAPPQP